MIQRHESERRIKAWVYDLNIQTINPVDRLPVRTGGATKRIDCELEAGACDSVDVQDVPQVAHVRQHQILLMRGGCFDRIRQWHAPYTCVASKQQLIGAILDPPSNISIGR